jgi:hypothetical protein
MASYGKLPTEHHVPVRIYPGVHAPQQPMYHQQPQPQQIHIHPQPAQYLVPPPNINNTWPKRPFGMRRANWFFIGMVIIVLSVLGIVLTRADDDWMGLFIFLANVGLIIFTIPFGCCCGVRPCGMTASEEREISEAYLKMLQKQNNPQRAPPLAPNNMPSGTTEDNKQQQPTNGTRDQPPPQSYAFTVEQERADARRRYENLTPEQAVEQYNGRER